MYSRENSPTFSNKSMDSESNMDDNEIYETPERYFERNNGLRSIEEISPKYRHIFQYSYFNKIQSQVLDDVLYSDKSIVVSAPTGSGKTAIFELAIVRLLRKIKKLNFKKDFKIIYMAPMKALCTERLMDWYGKFTKLGITSIEVTGDSDALDFNQIKTYNIIMTTPEKWDSLTRRWKENKDMMDLVKLFIIDEVHLLNEDVRGPVLEAVISRMKTIQESINMSNLKCKSSNKINTEFNIRFVAASATIPNAEDIAEWLSTRDNTAVCYKMGEEYRPVKLTKIVEGYHCKNGQSLFKFDLFLNYKLRGVIEKYCDGKPTLIFCNTRKSVMLTAETLSRELLFHFTTDQTMKFKQMATALSEKKLQTLVLGGIGCHHAGLLMNDRNIIEQMFKQGDLPVLITTSTLAMGVNLPAHLVIIKTTQHYVNGSYTEYDESSILQMIGRAGRPQFDNVGIAVIMTKIQDKERYEKLCGGQRAVESKLHKHLVEHLNAEIALGTLPDLLFAMDWLRSTFLYVRAKRNPSHYGCNRLDGQESVEKKLQEICVKWINALARAELLVMDADTRIKSTEAGYLMATHCLDFETMKLILKIKGNESLSDILKLVSECHEFEDIVLRASEKRCLNQLNKKPKSSSNRFPLPGKIQTKHMKANCLIQAVFGNLPIFDPSLNQESIRIMRTGENIAKCIVTYLSRPSSINGNKPIYKSLLNAIILVKCFAAKMWENSLYVCRQLNGIGPAFANLLVNAGKTSFDIIRQCNPRDLERILNKGPPVGNNILKQVILLPLYSIELELDDDRMLNVRLSIKNNDNIKSNISTTGSGHKVSLIVGDSENNLLLYTIINDKHLLNMPNSTINRKICLKTLSAHTVFVHCISNNWVGLDVNADINVKESYAKVIPSELQRDIKNYISKSFLNKNIVKSNSMNMDENENYDYLFNDVIEDSQNCVSSDKKSNLVNDLDSDIKEHEIQCEDVLTNDKVSNWIDHSLNLSQSVKNKNANTTLCSIWKNKKYIDFEEEIDEQEEMAMMDINDISDAEFMKSFDSEPIECEEFDVLQNNLDDKNLDDIISQQIEKYESLNKQNIDDNNGNVCKDFNSVIVKENNLTNYDRGSIDNLEINSSNVKNYIDNGNSEKHNEINFEEFQNVEEIDENEFETNITEGIHNDNQNSTIYYKDAFEENQTKKHIFAKENISNKLNDINELNIKNSQSKNYIDNENHIKICEINFKEGQNVEEIDENEFETDIEDIHEYNQNENNKIVNELETFSFEESQIKNHNFSKEHPQKDSNFQSDFYKNCNQNYEVDSNDNSNETSALECIKLIEQTYDNNNTQVTSIKEVNIEYNNGIQNNEIIEDLKATEFKEYKSNDKENNVSNLMVKKNLNKNHKASTFNGIQSEQQIFDDNIPNKSNVEEKPHNDNNKNDNEIVENDQLKEQIFTNNYLQFFKMQTNQICENVDKIVKNIQTEEKIVSKNDIQSILKRHSQQFKEEFDHKSQFRSEDIPNVPEEILSNINKYINNAPKNHNSIRDIFVYDNEDEILNYYNDESTQYISNVSKCQDNELENDEDVKQCYDEDLSPDESNTTIDQRMEENILDPQWVLTNAYKKYQNSVKENEKTSVQCKCKSNKVTGMHLHNDEKSNLNLTQYSIFADSQYSQSQVYSLKSNMESPTSSQLTIDTIRQFARTPKNKLKPIKRMRYS